MLGSDAVIIEPPSFVLLVFAQWMDGSLSFLHCIIFHVSSSPEREKASLLLHMLHRSVGRFHRHGKQNRLVDLLVVVRR
jgi:hypothetical protein